MRVSTGKYRGKINIDSFETCTRIPVFIRLGCQIFNVFKVQNVAKNMTKTSFEFTAEKRAKNEPKRTPKRDPHPLEIRQKRTPRFSARSGLVN